eukprot:4251536-Amphidinium_carterae.2
MAPEKKRALDGDDPNMQVDTATAQSTGSADEIMKSIAKVLAEIGQVKAQVSVLPQMSQKLDHTATRVDMLESRLNRLEESASGSQSDISGPPGLRQSVVKEESVWLAGNWPNKKAVEDF